MGFAIFDRKDKEDAAMRPTVGFGAATQKDLEAQIELLRYLDYLNNRASGERVVKTMDLCDQKTAP